MARRKTLIHIHTDYSFDSDISVEALASFAHRNSFGCIAVTDHDSIDGAQRLRCLADVQVIIGEEVTTTDGHLIGLFLKERVKPGMSARDTAIAIKQQGGIVLLPHPFVRAFGCGLGKVSWDVVGLIDAVEVCNSQNLLKGPDREAERFARETGLPRYVGADSHVASSIAPCYQRMTGFSDPAGFLTALGDAELVRGYHRLGYFASAAYRVALDWAGLPLPAGFGARSTGADSPAPIGPPAVSAEPVLGRSARPAPGACMGNVATS